MRLLSDHAQIQRITCIAVNCHVLEMETVVTSKWISWAGSQPWFCPPTSNIVQPDSSRCTPKTVWKTFPPLLECVSKKCIQNKTACFIIAERLSARLLILQIMFSVGGVWPRFRNASKGVACTQTSVPFRNAIKKFPFTKSVYTYISLSIDNVYIIYGLSFPALRRR